MYQSTTYIFFKPQEAWRPIWRMILHANPENVKEKVHRLVEESMEPKVIQISDINHGLLKRWTSQLDLGITTG